MKILKGTFVLAAILCFGDSIVAQTPRLKVQERPGNAIVMDDNFEYAVIDYGVGHLQARPADQDSSPPIFWLKLRVLNKSEHSIQRPRYVTSSPLSVKDNWGNTYALRLKNIELGDVGEGRTYKPGESSWGLRVIDGREFVSDITELQIYLDNRPRSGQETMDLLSKQKQGIRRTQTYFKITQPLARQRNLLQGQADPEASELHVAVTETQ